MKKVRMTVEFNLNETTLREKGMTPAAVVEAIECRDHDTIDGFEIYPAIEDCDVCSDFFLFNPNVVSKEVIDPLANIPSDMDAVFLPGKIHGCEDQLYIIYLNPDACDGEGSFEIEIIDYERILKIYEEVNGDAEEFFAVLPDWFHGEWYYCDPDHGAFESYIESFHDADFICGRDGDAKDQLEFMVNWAKGRAQACVSSSAGGAV